MTLDFMILGAQKAATTSLQQALRASPEVFMPVGESAFFEDPEFDSKPWANFGDPQRRAKVSGIKRPDNLCRNDLRRRIAASLPDLRFIVVLREPISRAVSAYYHLARHAHLPVVGPDEAISQGLKEFEQGLSTPASSLIEYGLYGAHLKEWFALYAPERFVILSQAQIGSNLTAAVAACCHLLDVRPPGNVVLASQERNVGLYDDRWIPLYSMGHRLKTRPVSESSRRAPSQNPFRRALGQGLVRTAELLAATDRKPATLGPETHASLVDIYREDLRVLRKYAPATAVTWSFDEAEDEHS